VNAPLYYEKSVYEKLFFKKFAKSIENWICNNATHAITVTKVLKDMLVKQGVDANNVSVIHNGINQEEFKNNLSGDEIRNKYSFGQNELVIGMVGWFRDWHGLDLLIDACHQKNLFKKENIKLLLVGDGPAVVKNKKKVKDLSLENYVIFTGAIQRTFISKYIAALDIAIQPRVTSYACPMKIIEYMAAGKAIVAPDQPNIRELLKDNYNAFLFKPEDLNDLFTKIDLLIEDAKSRNFISKNAKITLAEKNLFWFENAKRVVNLLNNLN
jgi:glycosyltransferase involved in cell wall biosynthesis